MGPLAIAAVTGIHYKTIDAVRRGSHKRLLRSSEQKILACTAEAIGDHTIIPGDETWRLIAQLIAAGMPKKEIALRLGSPVRPDGWVQIRVSKRGVRVRTARAVKELHRNYTAELRARAVEARQLAVERDGSLVPAHETHATIRTLLRNDYTIPEIERELGMPVRLDEKRIEPRLAVAVRRLADEFAEAQRVLNEIDAICGECGHSHAPGARDELLRRELPTTASELKELRPCWWGRDEAGDRRLFRDLGRIGAVHGPAMGDVWTLVA